MINFTNMVKIKGSAIFLAIYLISLLLPIVLADTYADLEINIDGSGKSTIRGASNIALGQIPANETINGFTDELTAKKQSIWTFSLITNKSINISLIKVHLPIGATVSAIKSSQSTLIANDDAILLTFIGRNEPINITIQYSLDLTQVSNISKSQQKYGWYAIIAAIFIVTIGVITLARKYLESKKKLPSLKKIALIKPTLNETQVKIIDTLIECGGVATQNKIHHITQIPKASLSRNVDLLVQKQLLVKQSGGYTNQISFHESYYKD